MGDVIMFRPRVSKPKLNPEAQVILRRMHTGMGREATRRATVYGSGDVTPGLLRVLALYPMFRLTHAKRARRCLYCGHRIEPLELHFVHAGAYVCQSGACMDEDGRST